MRSGTPTTCDSVVMAHVVEECLMVSVCVLRVKEGTEAGSIIAMGGGKVAIGYVAVCTTSMWG